GILDGDLNFRSIALGNPPGAHDGPVARVCLDDSALAACEALEGALQKTEFTPELLKALRTAYRTGAGMADAFAQFVESVLGPRGLVLYDSSDPAAKALVAGLVARGGAHAGEHQE